jgi:hypothetical protein
MSHQESIIPLQEPSEDSKGTTGTPSAPESLLDSNNEPGETFTTCRPPGVQGAAKHIRRFCLECMGGPGGPAAGHVKLCTGFSCPLWFWRFGKDPRSVKDQSLLDKSAVREAAKGAK